MNQLEQPVLEHYHGITENHLRSVKYFLLLTLFLTLTCCHYFSFYSILWKWLFASNQDRPQDNTDEGSRYFIILLIIVMILLFVVDWFSILFPEKKTVVNGMVRKDIKMEGKTVLITGANSGIGYAAALDLLQRGAKIIIASRSMSKMEEAKAKVIVWLGLQKQWNFE